MLKQLMSVLVGILGLVAAAAVSYTYLSYTVAPRDTSLVQTVLAPNSTSTTKAKTETPPATKTTASQPVAKSSSSKSAVEIPVKTNGSLVPSTTTAQKTVVAPTPLRVVSSVSAGSTTLTVQGVIEHTNYQRVINGGLAALTENALLDRDAQLKLNDMFAKQYFEHVSPTGVGPADLAVTVGYQYVVVGENLALGNFAGDAGVVTAWMNSPGHRANILNPHYQEIGVAVGKGMYEGHETWLAVQSFGMPISACPSIDANLKTVITANNAQIENLKAILDSKKTTVDQTSQASVDEYNALVAEYNNLVELNRANVATYNAGVQAFNNCISEVGVSSVVH